MAAVEIQFPDLHSSGVEARWLPLRRPTLMLALVLVAGWGLSRPALADLSAEQHALLLEIKNRATAIQNHCHAIINHPQAPQVIRNIVQVVFDAAQGVFDVAEKLLDE